ncbi:MAG: M23 family metallopeptidase [Chloroflexi bacterium]|nr:M23 family metallopeptidase [Chloroflexota bacterium]
MADPIYLRTDSRQFFSIGYFDDGNPARQAAMAALWKNFNRPDPSTGETYRILYRLTSRDPDVYVAYFIPPNVPAGRYRAEMFVPGRHATTRRAYFTIANKFRDEDGQRKHDESVAVVDMFDLFDVWTSLGEYDLDPGRDAESGRVHLVSQSTEDPPAEIAFGPVRWAPVVPMPPGAPPFSPPLGTAQERANPFPAGAFAFGKYPIWVGQWFDINPFLSWYSLGYHTGADLNLPGTPDADKDAPIYAVADGVVTNRGTYGGWGNLIVIEHPDALVTLPDGRQQRQKVYTRYGHTRSNILVQTGAAVTRGQHIAYVGAPASAPTAWHLHFDVGYTATLRGNPAHWPNMSRVRALQQAGVSENSADYRNAQAAVKAEVIATYLDPLRFLKDNGV